MLFSYVHSRLPLGTIPVHKIVTHFATIPVHKIVTHFATIPVHKIVTHFATIPVHKIVTHFATIPVHKIVTHFATIPVHKIVTHFATIPVHKIVTPFATTLHHPCIIMLQVIIGSRTGVVGVEDTSYLSVGSLVAVNVEEWDPPCIGLVSEVKGEEEVEVAWLRGSYTKPWLPWMVPDSTDQRRKTQWCTAVRREAILLYDFKLTKGNKLRRNVIQALKEQYEALL